MGSINNIPTLVQIMAWRRPGYKQLSEPMMLSLHTHICVTRPQSVNPGRHLSNRNLMFNMQPVFLYLRKTKTKSSKVFHQRTLAKYPPPRPALQGPFNPHLLICLDLIVFTIFFRALERISKSALSGLRSPRTVNLWIYWSPRTLVCADWTQNAPRRQSQLNSGKQINC